MDLLRHYVVITSLQSHRSEHLNIRWYGCEVIFYSVCDIITLLITAIYVKSIKIYNLYLKSLLGFVFRILLHYGNAIERSRMSPESCQLLKSILNRVWIQLNNKYESLWLFWLQFNVIDVTSSFLTDYWLEARKMPWSKLVFMKYLHMMIIQAIYQKVSPNRIDHRSILKLVKNSIDFLKFYTYFSIMQW